MTRQDLTFTSPANGPGTTCAAWHFPAADDRLATSAGRPAVVMAHGLGGTKDSGLEPFAEAFAAAGLDVLLFDYRGFGASEGTPRQTVSLAGQIADYQAAVTAAGSLPGVDRNRIVLWGVSLAGGHVLSVAAGRADVAAVIAVVPMVDGLAAAAHATKSHTPLELARATGLGIASKVAAARGKGSRMMPVVARPGEVGALTLPGALEDMLSVAGPTWRNEIAAEVSLELGTRAPAKAAKNISCPVLMQIADFDASAPPHAAAKAAFAAQAEVRHYPGDHFDLFPGKPFHEAAVKHAVRFLERHLEVSTSSTSTGADSPSVLVEPVETAAPESEVVGG
ncbi:alpha/beta hydrolase [Nocardioides marmorisolisilvae]|uniref:Alpha/beta hydrolase n=1 Tax=Nocardioides marmorisolisilvae TaxID=1542737 RepID=A0A3N0DX37_9ACTN|nr:alpha/beta hydrolase [Nocardioides marmorisolisilvae]RNL80121.1 alpha/beta hydrolase [Nocardioides marmorisolisilvae]